MSEIKEAIESYKKLAKIPSIIKGKISNIDENILSLSCEYTARNLEESTKTKFSKNICAVFDGKDNTKVINFSPIDISSELVAKSSPSNKKRLVLRSVKDAQNKDKQYLELWVNNLREYNINVDDLELHGKINEDEQFGSFDWSSGEKSVLYTAERFRPKSKSFFKKSSTSSEDENVVYGEEYLYMEDWGEQLVGKCSPIPCIFDTVSGDLQALDFLPSNVSFGQSVWSRNGEIISVGWFHEKQKLGLIYCANRRSAIFRINPFNQEYEIISSQDNAVQLPLMSPQKTNLIYFENKCLGPHKHCSMLKMYDWKSTSVVVDQVSIPTSDGFPGLYPLKCLYFDENRIIVSSSWESRSVILLINLNSGKVTNLTDDPKAGSWNVLDVNCNFILATKSSLNSAPELMIGKLNDENIQWFHLDENSKIENLDINWEILTMTPNHGDSNHKLEVLYCEPSNIDTNFPLIVWPHGGPHSVISSSYNFALSVFCKLGYSVLLVNYRGSTGFGQKPLESLLGEIGDQDVKDVQQTVNEIMDKKPINKEKVFVYGGSHGGFLATHLIGQYPDFYAGCACRNPVIELGCNADASDIPDWSWTEAGIGDDVNERSLVTPRERQIFYDKSPMKHIDNVKTPTLIMLGSEDRRVPHFQAIKYYKALKVRNIKAKLFIYKDNHSIAKVGFEADAFFNTILWFNEC